MHSQNKPSVSPPDAAPRRVQPPPARPYGPKVPRLARLPHVRERVGNVPDLRVGSARPVLDLGGGLAAMTQPVPSDIGAGSRIVGAVARATDGRGRGSDHDL